MYLGCTAELLSREAAEAAIEAAAAISEARFVLLAVINDANRVAGRFGSHVGERMLTRSVEYFRTRLQGCEQLYCWRGDAFIVILSRSERIDQIRAEIRRFANGKLEERVEIGDRRLLIPITWRWSVMQMAGSAEAMLAKIEALSAPPVAAGIRQRSPDDRATLLATFARKFAPAVARARDYRMALHGCGRGCAGSCRGVG